MPPQHILWPSLWFTDSFNPYVETSIQNFPVFTSPHRLRTRKMTHRSQRFPAARECSKESEEESSKLQSSWQGKMWRGWQVHVRASTHPEYRYSGIGWHNGRDRLGLPPGWGKWSQTLLCYLFARRREHRIKRTWVDLLERMARKGLLLWIGENCWYNTCVVTAWTFCKEMNAVTMKVEEANTCN